MGRKFTISAILDGVTPRKDGSLTLRFVTQEVSKDDMVIAMEYYQSMGHLLFAENEINVSDIPKGNAYLDGGKSPSQRLRDRLYVYYKEKNIGTPEEFDKWRDRQFEKIGQQYLDKLEK
jgi:hypothetical protein